MTKLRKKGLHFYIVLIVNLIVTFITIKKRLIFIIFVIQYNKQDNRKKI